MIGVAALALTVTVSATGYCQDTINSEGHTPQLGEVAVPEFGQYSRPLGSLIEVIYPRRVLGRRLFRVADHIGSGSVLDFFVPNAREPNCSFGRKRVTYRVRKRLR